MPEFEESELILTSENRVYHLNLKNDDIADDVILVGDPGRVNKISSLFSRVHFKTSHREFITHTGSFNGKRITVISTGIGPDNIDIVLNELDAAVNIDPHTRTANKKHRSLNIIRLGTSGSIQADVPVNSLVTSSHGLGLDGLLHFYSGVKDVNDADITGSFVGQARWNAQLPAPYCVAADEVLFNRLKQGTVTGITATAPGFYAPQGRKLRLEPAIPDLGERLAACNFGDLRIINFEMETSAIYGLGKLLGHRCVTVCVIIANRSTREFAADHDKCVAHLIEQSLNKLTS
jgi:uridine phosphorylase